MGRRVVLKNALVIYSPMHKLNALHYETPSRTSQHICIMIHILYDKYILQIFWQFELLTLSMKFEIRQILSDPQPNVH